jgi:hypothetical protein
MFPIKKLYLSLIYGKPEKLPKDIILETHFVQSHSQALCQNGF